MSDQMVKIVKLMVADMGLLAWQVESVINLIDEGNTIPFISRYRKEATGGMSDEVLRDFDERLKYIRNLESRKLEVLRLIDEQGKLTEELKRDIESAKVLQRVEDLYRPYKQKKRTRGVIAREKGLEPLAAFILSQGMTEKSTHDHASEFINEEIGVLDVESAINGALDIIAEDLSDRADFREAIRRLFLQKGEMVSKATDKNEKTVYEMYYDFSEPIIKIPNHRILAIDRGEKEKALKVNLVTNETELLGLITKSVLLTHHNDEEKTTLVKKAIQDAIKRLIYPSVENEVRGILSDRAGEEAIKVFAKNTKPLLMSPPLKDVRVLAIDPGFRTGCKVTVLDETGKLLEYATIYPHEPQNDKQGAERKLIDLIERHGVDILSVGNGTASRETEALAVSVIRRLESTYNKKLAYTIVSEAGASVYSASKLATDEYPDLDVSIRGAISIGRRLQDPLAELVKIDPKSIGVGQYQHDVNQKQLTETLGNVVEDCVNSVGVDLNTATPSLLKYVSGINETVAKNIVIFRDENGKFTNRKQLKKVKKLGDKAFEQSAGFLRIADGDNPLDSTAVHPESYVAASKLLKRLKVSDLEIRKGGLLDIEQRIKTEYPDLEALATELEIGILTLTDMVNELKKPGRDPREEMPKPILRNDILSIEDLAEGTILQGTVRNVVDFGAFVDIGVKNDGLVHISELSDKFIKSPYGIIAVGDIVNVKVIKVDKDRGKVSLSMKGLGR